MNKMDQPHTPNSAQLQPSQLSQLPEPRPNAAEANAPVAAVTVAAVTPPSFDLASQMDRYRGPIKTERIMRIVTHCPDIRQEALEIAVEIVKTETSKVDLYQELVELVRSTNPRHRLAIVDSEWVASTGARNQETQLQWQQNAPNLAYLSGQDLIKAYRDYSDYLISVGDYSSAQRYAHRGRDFMSTDKNAELNYVAKSAWLSVMSRGWTYTRAIAYKVFSSNDYPSTQPNSASVRLSLAISMMHTGEYSSAIAVLLSIPAEELGTDALNNALNDLATTDDVAIYIALTALVSLDRSQLKFLLEKDPVFAAIGRATSTSTAPTLLRTFVASDFPEFFKSLDAVYSDLYVDPFLGDILNDISAKIRLRAIQHYLTIYTNVPISDMARDLGGVSQTDLLIELRKGLEQNGQSTPIRIDTTAGIITSHADSGLPQVLQTAQDMAERYRTEASALLWSIEAIKLTKPIERV